MTTLRPVGCHRENGSLSNQIANRVRSDHRFSGRRLQQTVATLELGHAFVRSSTPALAAWMSLARELVPGSFTYRDAIYDDSPSSIPDRNCPNRFGRVKRPGPMGHAMARSGRGRATARHRHPPPGSLCPPVSNGRLSSKTRLHPSSTNSWRNGGAHASGAPSRRVVRGMPHLR